MPSGTTRLVSFALGLVAMVAAVLVLSAPLAGAAPVDFFSVSNATVTEGDSGTVLMNFTVSYTGPLNDISVDWATADGNAVAGTDYAAASGTATFTAASGSRSQPVTVAVDGDLLDEANETFVVDLSNPLPSATAAISDGQGLGTITDNDPLPALSIDDVTVAEGSGGSTSAVFVVTLSQVSGRNVTVNYATSNGSASAPSDYTTTSGTLTFTPGETTRAIPVSVVTDLTDEVDETFSVSLSSPGNATVTDASGLGTITDDDAPPLVSIGDVSFAEATSNLTFTLTLSAASAKTITVDYATADGTALAPADYGARTGTLTFTAGQLTRTFTVPVVGDTLDEFDETFLANLSNPSNATIADVQGVATIVDNDAPPTIRVNDVTVTEGDAGSVSATFAVTLSAASGKTVAVDFATSNGTASSPADFGATSGTATFPPGTTSQPLVVSVAGDLLDEINEAYNVSLSNPSNATIADALGLGTITDNDPLPSFGIGDITVSEGTGGTTNAVFTVSLSSASGRTTAVRAQTANGTGTSPSDFAATTVNLSLPAGTVSQTVTVPVVADVMDENDETFVVNLSNVGNAAIADPQAVGTISDDDAPPSITIADASRTEGNSGTATMTFTVTLAPASGKTVTVDYATADGSALAPSDYQTRTGTLTFTAGQLTRTFTVPVVGDTLDEFDEMFVVNLSNPSNGTIVDGQAVGTIVDNDAMPTMTVNDVTIPEGDTGSSIAAFTVSLSGPSGRPISVDFSTTDGTATDGPDYAGTSGTLSFALGDTTEPVDVAVHADLLDEFDETFTLDLSNGTNVVISDGQALGTIGDDDPTPVVSVADLSVDEGDSGTTTASLVLRLSAPSGKPITVDLATADGTAVAGPDYATVSGPVSFPQGETEVTVDLAIAGDTTYEGDETFGVTVSNPANAVLGDDTAVVTIANDDPLPSVTVDDVATDEGDAGTQTLTFTIGLSNPSAFPITVDAATTDGTATTPDDYDALATTVPFAPGDVSETIDVVAHGDASFERDEVFSLDLSGVSGATIADGSGSGTIRNDDAEPSLEIDDLSMHEGSDGDTVFGFAVTLVGETDLPVTVDVATFEGTADSPSDFDLTTTSLSFAPGVVSRTFDVQVHGDDTFEHDEAFTVELSRPVDAVLGIASATGTIENDDGRPSLVVDDATIVEGDGTVRVAVRLTNSSAFAVSVVATTVDGSATAPSDFDPVANRLTFAPGQRMQTVDVTVHGDLEVEGSEAFEIVLSDATDAGIQDGSATVKIYDDELVETHLTVAGHRLQRAGARISGRLIGGQPAMGVQVTLFVRRDGRWVRVARATSLTVATPGASGDPAPPTYRATFRGLDPGRYLVRASYRGDERYGPSYARDRFSV